METTMTKLKTMRRNRRLKLREIAKKIGVTIQGVQRMEIFGIKKRSTAERYAAALGCDWKDLID